MDCDRPLVKLLKESGLLRAEVDSMSYTSDVSFPIKTLAHNGHLLEKDAIRVVATRLGIPSYDLHDEQLLKSFQVERLIAKVSSEFCLAHKVLPLREDKEGVIIAFANPLDVDAQKQLRFIFDRPIILAIAEEDAIVSLLTRHMFSPLGGMNASEATVGPNSVEILAASSHEECDLDQVVSDIAPVIKFVNRIIIEGLNARASDIHLDPTPNGLDVRYRIDGIMQHAFDCPKRLQRSLVSRVKLLSGMNIAEKRSPQDGRFRIKYGGDVVDLRVSCIPTAYGEKVVVRILKSDFSELSFEKLGLPTKISALVRNDLETPGRMILVTGPTGSGKTTTLYTALRYLCDGTNNIETVEDPIEYKIPGVNQIQINEAAHVTFASCLRSILRQDPDVIMIGEIRDAETADIGLQAAQTGHIVLSTLHTNDAPSAITRLLDLHCDRFVLSTSLAGIMAQRLVRRLCKNCSVPVPADEYAGYDQLIRRKEIDTKKLKRARGCTDCRYTGYQGRIGIYSYLHVSHEVASLIHHGASLQEVVKVAASQGFQELDVAAKALVESGETSLEEVRPYLATDFEYDDPDTVSKNSETRPNDTITLSHHHRPNERLTIMLVEDDYLNRTTLACVLRKSKFRVMEMENGVEALNKMKQIEPDIIVSGLGLPQLDGKHLLQRLHDDPEFAKIPFIVLTSADSDENEAELLRLGADDFVSRSRSPEVLVERIQRIIKGR